MNRRIKKKKMKQKEKALMENSISLSEVLVSIERAIPKVIESYCRVCNKVIEVVKSVDWNTVLKEYAKKQLEESNEQETKDNQPS